VDDEQIRIALNALPGDRQNHMGIDRHHRCVDNFDALVRVSGAQHDFQHPRKADRRIGIPQRC